MSDTADRIVKMLTSPDGQHRALVVQRPDGAYSCRRRWLQQTDSGSEWGAVGPYLGIYDSAGTAEMEALARVKCR